MIPSPQAIETKVQQVVNDLKAYHPQQVILFGSTARGDADQYSDLDFVILKHTTQPFLERLKEVALLCTVPGAIDFLVYTPQEWRQMQEMEAPFAQRVLTEGRTVYEAQP